MLSCDATSMLLDASRNPRALLNPAESGFYFCGGMFGRRNKNIGQQRKKANGSTPPQTETQQKLSTIVYLL